MVGYISPNTPFFDDHRAAFVWLICAILNDMKSNHHIWRVWVNLLHRWGLQAFAASFLEAVGPLAILGAQLVYIGSPLLRPLVPATHLDALAKVLEDTDEAQDFIHFLQETA